MQFYNTLHNTWHNSYFFVVSRIMIFVLEACEYITHQRVIRKDSSKCKNNTKNVIYPDNTHYCEIRQTLDKAITGSLHILLTNGWA